MNWGQLAIAAAPIVAGLIAGRKGKKDANEAAGGARFAQLTPQMFQLIAQQLAQSNQNYQQQQERYSANQPLMDSIRRMATGMTPTRYQSPMPSAQAPRMPQQAMAPMAQARPEASTGDILDDYQRRGGGTGGAGKGALSGASMGASIGSIIPVLGTGAGAGIGAIAGGITGAIKKHAKSAPTDFKVGDAEDAVQRAYQTYLGRPAMPDEIQSQLSGQGYRGTGRWVGESGLMSVLKAIQDSEEARGRRV
jgi:hypothetical protein